MSGISGIPFQYEIQSRAESAGWKTEPEQSYIDDVEEKTRSIDFVATVDYVSHNHRGNQLAVVAETKYIKHDASVYLQNNPKDKKAYFLDGFWSEDFEAMLNNFHFISAPRVARTITDTEKGKENLFGAVSQAYTALMYLRGKPILNKKGLFYPLVVYRGKKIIDQSGNELRNVLYYQTYEWRSPETRQVSSRSMYVDIVHENHFEEYLNLYKSEMDKMMQVIYFHERIAENRKIDHRRNSAM